MNSDLAQNGFHISDYPLPDIVKTYLNEENYLALDQYFSDELKPEGQFFQHLNTIFPTQYIEHIIAVRESPEDEDGIWHDDGSRLFGFSLSLNKSFESILGGHLLFKSKNSDHIHVFPAQPFSRLIVFLTGQYGYEHKVTKVENGRRTVIAGWGYKTNPVSHL